MSYAVIDLIADLIYSVLGNGIIMAVFVFFFFTVLLFALRASLPVIIAVLIPLAVGLLLNQASTNFIEFPAYIVIVLFIIAGLLFSAFFLYMIR